MLLLKSLALVSFAAVVMARASPNAIVSGALFVGEDTTNPDASNTNIYKNPENHAAAAASVLEYSAVNTNYRPSEQAFQQKATSFPGFIPTIQSGSDVFLNHSLIGLEKAVQDAYPSTDAALIARGLRDLFPGSVEDQSLKEWILSLLVIRKPEGSDTVTIKFVQLALTIEFDKTHTAHIPEQDARLSNYELQVNPSVFALNADRFAEIIKVTKVPDFLIFFASPKVVDLEDGLELGSSPCDQKPLTLTSRLRQYRVNQWICQGSD
ncbi:hypothetical protein BGX33_007759 [Mortierella sp. NVP41]|nr:hypothetical protein BGX33_007759 [Mortierella sp. NVP41]